MAEKKTGFDTGFFVKILQNDARAKGIWADIQSRKIPGFVSCLSLYEIRKLALKSVFESETADIIINDIYEYCEIIWISNSDILTVSAKISHGSGIPAIDSLILSSMLNEGVRIIYTTDSHLLRYKNKGIKIIRL